MLKAIKLQGVQQWLRQYMYLPEAVMWLSGVAALALMSPEGEHLFSFCPFSWMWERGCPGCGLGHGIAYLFRGEWQASWNAHPLALPALILLLWRSVQLLRRQYRYTKLITIKK